MKKLLWIGLSIIVILTGIPVAALLVIATFSTQAAAGCLTYHHATTTETGLLTHAEMVDRLLQLRLGSGRPTITKEQAENAITLADVTRDLGAPRRGLEIALATAIQESQLVNLESGDRDSLGLFQQRPSQGWGTSAQITDPVLATRAFYGLADHTNNTGLLDINNWQNLPLTQAAQAVQRSGYPSAYARWESIAQDMTDILGPDLAASTNLTNGESRIDADCAASASVTVASFNILGAGHTDGKSGSGLGGGENPSMPTWDVRLPKAMRLVESAGVTIAGLQEVHPPQSKTLSTRYADRWGMFPTNRLQNKVIWDRTAWMMTAARLVDIPYFHGFDTPMPLVQLTSTTTGQVLWVWSIHNPIGARKYRVEALQRELATMTDLKATGQPVVIVGDFNDSNDAQQASHCILTPTLTNAFGGASRPCRPPKGGARIDHIYGDNLTWASARVDRSTVANKISDHPLVIATTLGDDRRCLPPALDHSNQARDCGAGPTTNGRVAYPVPAGYIDSDRHNWHATGSHWSSWHTGTDFSAPCGTPAYAAHAGAVEIDTTQVWAGTWLVKVTTGPSSLTTWYAHMQALEVSRGQKVTPGQRIGQVGARGNAEGCHLHFEVHLENGSIYGSDNVDPSTWLAQHATGLRTG